jgi:hypothetical protein
MKPLARWTLGPVSQCGKDILRESIKQFPKVYPGWDMILCCNNLHEKDLQFVMTLPVDVLVQDSSMISYPLKLPDEVPKGAGMAGSGWKLAPPRLRKESHELWIDNDIIIREPIPAINDWLEAQTTCFSEGLNRLYGIYDEDIPPDLKACAGLFGVPPYYDFNSKILDKCRKLDGKPLGHYDEQGLVISTMTSSNDHIVIPLSQVAICENHLPQIFPPGIHFVGANRKNCARWKEYQQRKHLITLL